jgi:hypothetical protein
LGRLGECRTRQSGQACRKQPRSLADHFLSPVERLGRPTGEANVEGAAKKATAVVSPSEWRRAAANWQQQCK